MRGGEVKALDLSDGIGHDRSAPAHHDPVEAGSLQLRDLGYFKLDDLQAIAQQHAFWLIRYKIGTVILDEAGHVLKLTKWLPQQVENDLIHRSR
jgi:hypothetical protein